MNKIWFYLSTFRVYLKFIIKYYSTQQNIIVSFPENITLTSRLQIPVQGRVAFFATKHANQGNLGINQNIVFDNVMLNLGNAYRPGHGLFITVQ